MKILTKLKIGVLNDKGGVGKSAIVQQIALANDLLIIELDPYGNLSTRLEGVTAFEQGEKVVLPKKGGFVVDFGGFAHEQEDAIIASLDVLCVPFTATAEAVETTYNMIARIKHIDIPILFIANRVVKKDEKASISAFKLFSKLLEDGANLGYIMESRTIQSAVNNAFNIIEVAKEKGIKGQPFKNMAGQLEQLFKTIKNTKNGEVLDV